MADIVVYEDSPLAQYMQDIQEEQHGPDLQHSPVPVREPGPKPDSVGKRMANNTVGMLTHLIEYLTHTFSPSASDAEDAEFEERFKYFICTSPFLNKAATLHTHERGRRTDTPITIEYAANFSPGRFGYILGFGTLATLIARSVLARTRVGRMPILKTLLSRAAAITLTVISFAWMLRIIHRRKLQTTQNQALRSLQLLVNECQSLDVKVNRAIMVIQEIELVSRGYRLSTPLAPISRIEQASKTRRCNMVRAQLVATLLKSGALFQKSTETLQSHIDHKRLSTLLDMYNITPSSRPNSPGYLDATGGGGAHITGTFASPSTPDNRLANLTIQTQSANNNHLANDSLTLTASPTSDAHMPLPSYYTHHARQHSASKRRSRTMTGGSNRSRPSSYHEPSLNSPLINAEQQRFLAFGRRPARRHHTSWSASEGEDSDSGSLSMVSPRSSIYSNADAGGSSPTASSPEMTSLERLRKNFQKMHGFRREFLCELLSIRRKSRKGRQGLHHALKDYDRNWTVVRDVLQEGLQGIEYVVAELSKVLDTELYTLPRIDTHGNNSSPRDKQLQPFVQRLALLEQHVRGVQAKLYICNEDIKETGRQDPVDTEKRRLLELQYDSISQDIGMMASEWQLGKTALSHVFEPLQTLPAHGSDSPSALSDSQGVGHGLGLDTLGESGGHDGPVVDSMETLEDQQRLMALAAKREETWEASTESGPSLSRRLGFAADGSAMAKMTRAERIAHQKLLREQEDAKKERVYDNSKMVHELKDVLGRRRHLRENDDDTELASGSSSIPATASSTSSRKQADQAEVEALGYSLVGAGSLAEQLARAVAERTEEQGGQSKSGTAQLQQYLSLAEEFSTSASSERVSPFSLSASVFASGSDSFVSFMESSIGPMDESIVEITGVGEADDEEEQEEEQQQQEEEEESHDGESEQATQI
ncbi:hypothetical protein EC957_003107 [Mortierella hygrophila]|uniref:Myosin-binding domain-containing protein n=1 Tax=Mortierella hygrophila TaxID=979708 RepID=A0A9P6K1E1_9FUNG|nr:hypothetical protein EC957_003107 [Mortierella hygrophila]